MNILRFSLCLATLLCSLSQTLSAQQASAPRRISGLERLQSRTNAEGRFELLAKSGRATQSMGYTDVAVPDDVEMPDNMMHWMQQVEAASQYVEEHPQYSLGAALEGLPVIQPLLGGIRWNQSAPYNDLCPTNTPVGCVATAMAQVLYYYRYPEHGFNHKSYDQGGVHHSVDFENTYYQWDKMYDIYDQRHPNPAGNAAVAELSYHCGVSVSMSYAPGGSGAYLETVPHALKKYFGYNSNANVRTRGSYTYEEWVQVLVDELEAGRPIIFAADNQDVGHCFVLDGINKEGLFHVNWGWGGYYNGYFDVGILNPDGAGIGGSVAELGYCMGQGAVVQLCPEEGAGEAFCPVTYEYYGIWNNGDNVSIGTSFRNNTGDRFQAKVGFEIINEAGEYCSEKTINTYEFAPYPQRGCWQWNQVDIDCQNLPDGSYTLNFFSEVEGTRYYILSSNACDMTHVLEIKNHHFVDVWDNRTIYEFSASNFSHANKEQFAVGTTYDFAMDVTNEGEDTFVGFMVLLLLPEDSEDLQDAIEYEQNNVKLLPGQTKNFSFPVLIDKKGNYELNVMLLNYAWGEYRIIGVDGCNNMLEFTFTDESPSLLMANSAAVLKNEHYEAGSEISFDLDVTNEGGTFADKVAIFFFQQKASSTKPVAFIEQDCDVSMTSTGTALSLHGTPANLKGGTKYYARPFYKNNKGDYVQMMLTSGLPAITDVMVYKTAGIEDVRTDPTEEAPAYDLMGRRIKGQPKGLYIQDHATSVR